MHVSPGGTTRAPSPIGRTMRDFLGEDARAELLPHIVEIDAKGLMLRADRALYRAKDGGRDTLAVGEG